MENLTRRKVRYWCFRFKTEKLGGDPANDSPDGLREHFENLEWFDSWLNFGITWDVRDDNPLVLSKLKLSHDESWINTLKSETKELPNNN